VLWHVLLNTAAFRQIARLRRDAEARIAAFSAVGLIGRVIEPSAAWQVLPLGHGAACRIAQRSRRSSGHLVADQRTRRLAAASDL